MLERLSSRRLGRRVARAFDCPLAVSINTVFPPGQVMQWSRIVIIPCVRICTTAELYLHDTDVTRRLAATCNGDIPRSVRMWISALCSITRHLKYLEVSIVGRVVKWGPERVVLGIHIRLVIE
jgi:hypothetical protein